MKRILSLAKTLMLVLSVAFMSQETQAAGTFRFLNTGLPEGSTSQPYYAVLLTANAVGAVTYTLDGASDPWPTGITMNANTGEIIGQALSSANQHMIINATDSNGTIQLDIPQFKINSSGSSGSSSITTLSLADGRVGVAYTPVTLGKSGGTGPFVWGVQNLPAGLSLDASTGEITGTPVEAGTFNITFALRDEGRTETIFRVLALTILPADPLLAYNFQFETSALVNGEVGTAYADQYQTSGSTGTVTYSASGLPAGLTLDSATGAVSGTPTEPGTYAVTIGATDSGGASISTNLMMWIVPSASSNFYWSYFGVPPGIINESYSQTPPVEITAANGTSVTYAASGLPPGMIYDSNSGELTGTPTQIGIYSVTFTATDTTPVPDAVLTLDVEFVVLPATGGDANRLPNNLWISQLGAKVVDGVDNDGWKAKLIYNDDRTTANIFDPATDAFSFSLGNSKITIPAGTMVEGTSGDFTYKTATGVIPAISVKGSPSKQTISVSVKNSELGLVFPVNVANVDVTLGVARYRVKGALSSTGKFKPTGSNRNTSFVVSKGKFAETGALSLTMNVADPSLQITQGDNVVFRLYKDTTLLLSKDITSMITITEKPSTSGITTYVIKKTTGVTDPAINNIFEKVSYSSTKGAFSLALSALSLAAPLTQPQEHLIVELEINGIIYTTDLTFFEDAAGSNVYSTLISTASTPF